MRILVVEDEFERAGLHVGHLRRLAFAADHAAATADAPISRRREDLREERAGALVPLRDSGHVAAQSS
jgi:hypothetical protein